MTAFQPNNPYPGPYHSYWGGVALAIPGTLLVHRSLCIDRDSSIDPDWDPYSVVEREIPKTDVSPALITIQEGCKFPGSDGRAPCRYQSQ